MCNYKKVNVSNKIFRCVLNLNRTQLKSYKMQYVSKDKKKTLQIKLIVMRKSRMTVV